MILLRSIDADWNFSRWETLPDDGNRYEVIDGVLYMATCPEFVSPVGRRPSDGTHRYRG